MVATNEKPDEALPSLCKAPEKYDIYSFKLSDQFKKIAKKELREDDLIREQSLTQMREWIAKHPYIRRCRTDSIFLLRFLRTKKFSVPLACEMLEKNLSVRQLYPDWFKKCDILDPDLEAIIDSGYLVPLPGRDANGRQILFSVAGALDLNRVTSTQLIRVHCLVSETMIDDEESQIAGYTHIIDDSNLSMKLLGLWSITDVRNLAVCIQNTLPLRIKENNFIGLPAAAGKFMEFCISLLSDKLKKRVAFYKTMNEVTKKVDQKLLPKEYGGTVPMSELIRQFKERARKRRAAVLALDDMHIEITKNSSYWAESCRADIDSGVIGSFRKLEVD